MQAYELTQLISQRAESNKLYLEFLKVPDLSMGLYVLPTGGTDPQSPHTEDEVYYVVNVKATKGLSAAEADQLRSLLNRVIENLQAESDPVLRRNGSEQP